MHMMQTVHVKSIKLASETGVAHCAHVLSSIRNLVLIDRMDNLCYGKTKQENVPHILSNGRTPSLAL